MEFSSIDFGMIIISIVLLGQLHRWICRQGAFLLVLTNLPSTICHELSHWGFARLLGSKTNRISFWPRPNGDRWTLGSVEFHPTIIATAPASMAPLVLFPIGSYLLLHRTFFANGSIIGTFWVYFAAYILISASIPSKQDIKVLITNPASLVLWSGIGWGVLYFWKQFGL